MGFGGKGANQCVMAARLGAATTIVAKVVHWHLGHLHLYLLPLLHLLHRLHHGAGGR